MQPAAKKCLWWAAISVALGIIAQVFANTILNALYSLWVEGGPFAGVPWWGEVVSAFVAVTAQLPVMIGVALIGAAVVINVLVPRIGSARAHDATEPSRYSPEETPASDRRDAVGMAGTSVYEPPTR